MYLRPFVTVAPSCIIGCQEDQSREAPWLCALYNRAVLIEKIGVSAREIVVEVGQKSELALLVVITREGAIEVPTGGLANIVAIEAKALVER